MNIVDTFCLHLFPCEGVCVCGGGWGGCVCVCGVSKNLNSPIRASWLTTYMITQSSIGVGG